MRSCCPLLVLVLTPLFFAGVDRVKAMAGLRRGFLAHGHCYTSTLAVVERDGLWCHLIYASLTDATVRKTMGFPGAMQPPLRFRIQFEQLWSVSPFFAGDKYWVFDIGQLLKGKLATGQGRDPEGYLTHFIQAQAGGDTIRDMRHIQGYAVINKHYDYLPITTDAARLFLLVDHPWSAFPNKSTGPMGKAFQDVLDGKKLEKKWRFTSAKYHGAWRLGRGWQVGTWSDPEELEVAFTEPFHVYGSANEYFFVTETGKVYHSPPLQPKQVGPRKVRVVWNNPKQPITHLLTDVDGKVPNRTFAFANVDQPEKANARDRLVFELQGPRANVRFFSSADLKPTKLQEPLKTLFEYAVLLKYGPPLESATPQEAIIPPATPPVKAGVTEEHQAGSKVYWPMVGAAILAVVAVAAFCLWRFQSRRNT